MNEQIQKLAEELFYKVEGTDGDADFNLLPTSIKDRWIDLAKHVLERELEARIEELYNINPDLRSESGITMQLGSSKHWALKRKIELTNQLQQLRGGK